MFLKFFKNYRVIKKKFKFKKNKKSIFFRIKFLLQKKCKYLSFYKKNFAGRGATKKIIFRNRSSVLKKLKFLKLNYYYRIKGLFFITNFHFIPFKNKIVTLLYFATGNVQYINTTNTHKLFSINAYRFTKTYQQRKKSALWRPLFFIKKLTFICCFGQKSLQKSIFVRSPGTSSRIEEKDTRRKTCLVILPSKQKLLLSLFSIVLFGRNALKSNRYVINTKAGYWRTFGKNSITRGVAMNPVDHPHGGRTKAIKYPRTPWGKTTKFK